jgi:hypothetical protein
MIRKLILIGLSLVIVVLASGCSGGADAAPPGAANAPTVKDKAGDGSGKDKMTGAANGAKLKAPGGASPLGAKAGGGN